MDKCPTCDGFGFLIPFPTHQMSKMPEKDLKSILTCDTCDGTGEAEINYVWQRQGEYLRYYRMDLLGLGLREACRKFDLDPSNLSKMERGLIKPQPPKELYPHE